MTHGISTGPDRREMASQFRISYWAGVHQQGKAGRQKLLPRTRQGFSEAYRCTHRCIAGNDKPAQIARCIGLNLYRNIIAMWLKRNKAKKKLDIESQKMNETLKRLDRALEQFVTKATHND